MELLTPKLGLFIWTVLIFLIFFFILARFAWKPIMKALKQREEGIQSSLDEAAKAREEMSALKSDNEKLLQQAREEREAILREAKEMKTKIVTEARQTADTEARRMLDNAREEIQAEKMAALTDIKNQVAKLSIEVAEKILRKEMENDGEQKAYTDKLVSDLNLN